MRPGSMIIASLLLLAATSAAAQPAGDSRPGAEVPFEFISVEIVRFDKPLRLGAGRPVERLKEALLVRVQVRTKDYDELPPDIEPYLYVGRREMRSFALDRSESKDLMRITYYSRDTRAPEDRAPMVITTRHGEPIRDRDRYARREDLKRFQKDWVKDRR